MSGGTKIRTPVMQSKEHLKHSACVAVLFLLGAWSILAEKMNEF